MQEDTDKANKHASVLERENQRLEIQVKDLSQQVRTNITHFFFLIQYWSALTLVNSVISCSIIHSEIDFVKYTSDVADVLKSISLGQCTISVSVYKIRLSSNYQKLKSSLGEHDACLTWKIPI